jgi:hypothetical protein
MSRRRIAPGEGVAEFLRFDADGGEQHASRCSDEALSRTAANCRGCFHRRFPPPQLTKETLKEIYGI